MTQPRYFYASPEGESGPHTSQELVTLATSGVIGPATLIRRDGSDTPSAAREWPALAKALASSSAQAPRSLGAGMTTDTELSLLRAINAKLSLFVWLTVGGLALLALTFLWLLFSGGK